MPPGVSIVLVNFNGREHLELPVRHRVDDVPRRERAEERLGPRDDRGPRRDGPRRDRPPRRDGVPRRLEAEHSNRSVLPDDPVLSCLDQLVEDFADEWMTKAMFHYRWHYPKDAAHAAPLLTFWQNPQYSGPVAQQISTEFGQRQISRLYVVGSSDLTAPVIESSFQRLVGIMDRIIERQGFVLGSRPASADFAIYGQLTQLGWVDPTPADLLARNSPRLRAWLDRTDDLSGHSAGDWVPHSCVRDHLGELLNEIGRVYAPFLIANAQAAARGRKEFETHIDGQLWAQPVFPYQIKCLETLRSARDSLSAENRNALDSVLAGTDRKSVV